MKKPCLSPIVFDCRPLAHIVVLATPSVELVREAVHLLERLGAERHGTAHKIVRHPDINSIDAR